MLSASYSQTPNAAMKDYSNFSFNNNYKSDVYNGYMNGQNNYNDKMYNVTDMDSIIPSHSNHNIFPDMTFDHQNCKDNDMSMISSRFHNMGIKNAATNSMSRSNSAHNSPFENRVTPRHNISQSTSNTPLPQTNRIGNNQEVIDLIRGGAPIVKLFNNTQPLNNLANPVFNSDGRQSPAQLIDYQSMASKYGFLVGQDLEDVLNRSATLKNNNSSRISNFFKNKHGSSNSHSTQKQYLVIGVRVPSKEHVSEIVGKEGKKIKSVRQKTGALITTPNEKEDHVFLIEAVPEIALNVGHMIKNVADQITRNKMGNGGGLSSDRPRSPPLLGNRIPLATATIGVPQRLVGKVIGTQGSIITTVQKETGTEIKSPPKDELRAPDDNADFEISVYENGTVNSEDTAWLQIHRAKQLIAHLVMRVWEQQPRNSTPSSDEGGCTTSNNISGPEWIWTEVHRMDDGDAKEIIDRILRSSKAKITPSNSTTEGSVASFENMLLNNKPVNHSSTNPNNTNDISSFPMSLLDSSNKQNSPGYYKMPYNNNEMSINNQSNHPILQRFPVNDEPWSHSVHDNREDNLMNPFHVENYYNNNNGDNMQSQYFTTHSPTRDQLLSQHFLNSDNNYMHSNGHANNIDSFNNDTANNNMTSWSDMRYSGSNCATSTPTTVSNLYSDDVKQLWKSTDNANNNNVNPNNVHSSLWMGGGCFSKFANNVTESTYGAVGDRRSFINEYADDQNNYYDNYNNNIITNDESKFASTAINDQVKDLYEL